MAEPREKFGVAEGKNWLSRGKVLSPLWESGGDAEGNFWRFCGNRRERFGGSSEDVVGGGCACCPSQQAEGFLHFPCLHQFLQSYQ